MIVTILRTVVLYLVVIIALRIMGKRQISEMQPNELVVTILISELAAIPMQDLNRPILNGVLAIIILVALELILTIVGLKSFKFRRVVNGKPTIIISDGVIIQKAMRDLRFTIDDVMEDLRLLGIFKLEDVAFAIVETNGKISALQKAGKLPVTVEQMNIPAPTDGLPVLLINDGRLQLQNAEIANFTTERIDELLKSQRLEVCDVFAMTGDKSGEFLIIKKQSQQEGASK